MYQEAHGPSECLKKDAVNLAMSSYFYFGLAKFLDRLLLEFSRNYNIKI